MDPEFWRAYSNRGLIKFNKCDLDGAIRDYDKSIQINPADLISYLNRGLAKCNKGNIEDGIADYDKAIQLDHNWGDSYFNRGIAKFKKGDIDGAIEDFDEAIRLNPNDMEARRLRDEALNKRPDNVNSRNNDIPF